MQQLLQLVKEVKFQHKLQLKLSSTKDAVREKPQNVMKEFFMLDETFGTIPNSTDHMSG